MPSAAAPPHAAPQYLDPAVLQQIGPLDLIARQVVEGVRVGMHRSPLHGFSTEFAQHRQYVPGDDIRRLDWRVYARASRYYVKLFEAETNFTANLLLDASSSMHYRSGAVSKIDYAKYLAASLAWLIVDQHDSVGLAVFDGELRAHLPPKGSLGVINDIATELARIQPQPRTDIAAILHQFANRMARRGVAILFSDLFDHVDQFLDGLGHLRFRGHNVIVFHVLDHDELTFPLHGTWKLKGMENDGEIITQPQRVRASYLAALDRFLTRIKSACAQQNVDYVLADTSRPVAEVLLEFLAARTHGPVRV